MGRSSSAPPPAHAAPAPAPTHGPAPRSWPECCVDRRKVVLWESHHVFRFKILNLSRQMGNAKLRIRVKPTDPDLATNQHLCIETRAFESRGRMLDQNEKRKAAEKRRAAAALPAPPAPAFRSLGAVETEDVFRSLGEEDENEDANPQVVTRSAVLQGPEHDDEDEDEDEARRAPSPTLTLT